MIGIWLPEKSPERTLARLCECTGAPLASAPPGWVRHVIRRIVRHLEGCPQDFSDLQLELSECTPFAQKVYEAARRVGPGQTLSYGELAARAGCPGAARAVGSALSKNRFPIVIPCHRIVGARGKPGGFSGFGGLKTKARLLEIEGVRLQADRRSKATPPLFFGGRNRLPFDAVQAARHLARVDDRLARLIQKIGPLGLRIEQFHSPYEALAEAIIFQQLNGKAAAAIMGRVKSQLGRGRFPPPKKLLACGHERLRRAGLSGPKIAALKDLAQHTIDGNLPALRHLARMQDEEIVERLTAIRGIGRWTVEMLLIFRLGRPDVLPVGDYGIRKALSALLRKEGLLGPAEVARFGERWRPYRTAASWYLWRLLDLPSWSD